MSYFERGEDFNPPDGVYAVTVYDASAFTSGDGREFAKTTLQIVGGDHDGQRFDHLMGLTHPVGREISGEALAAYGLDLEQVDSHDDLRDLMPNLLDVKAEVVVTHSKQGWVNVKVVRTITGETDIPAQQESFDIGDSPPARPTFPGAAASTDDDEEIPF